MVKERFDRSSPHVHIGTIGMPRWSKMLMYSSIGTHVFLGNSLQIGKTHLALEMERNYQEYVKDNFEDYLNDKDNQTLVPLSVYRILENCILL